MAFRRIGAGFDLAPDWAYEAENANQPEFLQIPIEQLASESNGILGRGENGVHCPRTLVPHDEPTSSGVDFGTSVEVERMGDRITWKYDPPIGWQEIGSCITDNKSDGDFLITEAYKFRHEQVCLAISPTESDAKMSMIESLQDFTDILSPDFILEDESGNYHVIEVTTMERGEEDRAQRCFRDKFYKYYEPLLQRSTDRCITFSVVIVSPDRVYSNIGLGGFLVRSLLLRMRRALAIERHTRGMGLDIKLGEDLSIKEKLSVRILETIKSMDAYSYESRPDAVFLDKDFVNRCTSDTSIEDKKVSGELFRKCGLIAEHQDKIPPQHKAQIARYTQKLNSVKPRNHGRKPVCIVPMVSPAVMSPDSEMSLTCLPGTNQAYLNKMWSIASTATRRPEGHYRPKERLKEEATTRDESRRKHLERERKDTMKKKNRVSMSLALKDPAVRKKLNEDGVMAKKAKKEDHMKNRRAQQSTFFDLRSNTDDIANWLDCKKMLHVPNSPEYPGLEKVFPLLEKSNNLQANSDVGLETVKDWSRTHLGRSMLFLSDLAAELTISMKQYCTGDDFILKKLQHFEAYVLMRTSGQDSHVFFSLFLNGTDLVHCNLPFRTLHKGTKGFYTDFVSIKKSKITNMLIAFPRLITLASFWGDFFTLGKCGPNDFYKSAEATRMLNLSVLLSLENKAQSEEVVTQTRYMYMEIFKSDTSVRSPDPFKVLSKMPHLLRSRMAVFLLQRTILNFQKMIAEIPTRNTSMNKAVVSKGEESAPGDQWYNLLNFVTGERVQSATSVVNLFYLGYLKDKNENGEKNSEWGLVEKIVEEELKYSNARRMEAYGAKASLADTKGKSFNMSCMKHGARKMQQRLMNTYGTDWKKFVTKDIINALASLSTESIASLKASAMIKHETTSRVTSLEDAEKTVRVKVIEAVASRLDDLQENPFLTLPAIVKKIEDTTQGVVCDLFKKAQHGGLREIYVLTIESRILQLYVETIARTLCSYFEEETLTHPENKLKLLDRHKVRSSQIASSRRSVSGDFCNSSDKTRWNQNFLMTNMSVCLFSLTEDFFHCSITRVMNLWSNKLIKMPPGVLSVLMRNQRLSSETFASLSEQYHSGKAPEGKLFLLRSRKSPFLRLTTGMMQGILHYTSSLQHIALLCSSRYWIKKTLERKWGPKGMAFSVTNVCSSDDSATILTFYAKMGSSKFGKDEVCTVFDCRTMMHTMTLYCEFYSMVESTKSTIGVFDYVEFNSEFIFKNTIAVPTIKSVAACLNLTEAESFIRRFYEQYNLLTSLEASGFPHYNTHLCQLAQALLHYHSIGSGTSFLFPDWSDEVIDYPDPVHGFFLLDAELAPGVMGFGYSLWNALQTHSELSASFLGEKGEEVSMSPDGVVTKSLKIKFGDNKRWGKMMNRILHKKLEVRETIFRRGFNREELNTVLRELEENPECLFRPARSVDEVHTKLLCRAMATGVAESLGKGNPLYNAYSSSVYILYSNSFTKVDVTREEVSEMTEQGETVTTIKPVKRIYKTSLWRSLRDSKERSELQQLEEEDVIQENLRTIGAIHFPLSQRYKEAQRILGRFRDAEECPTHILRQRKSTIVIQSSNMNLPVTIRQAVAYKWFQIPLQLSMTTINRCWSQYLLTYPWLKETWKDTLESSPFESFLDLYNFVSGVTNSSRRLYRVGPTIGTSAFPIQLSNLIRLGYKRNTVLCLDSFGKTGVEEMKGDRLLSNLSLALNLPSEEDRKEFARGILHELRDTTGIDPAVTVDMNYTMFSAWIMAWVESSDNIDNLVDVIKTRSYAIRLAYLQPQKRVINQDGSSKWIGEGVAMCSVGAINLKLFLYNEQVTEIVCNRPDLLRKDVGLLMNVFSKLSSRARLTTTIPSGTAYKFTGSSFIDKCAVGTPIVLDDKLPAMDDDLFGIHVRYGQGCMDLMVTLRGDRAVSILTHRMQSRHIDIQPDPTFTPSPQNRLSECWSKATSAHHLLADSVVNKLARGMMGKAELTDKEKEYKPWIQRTLRKRLEYLNHLPKTDMLVSEAGTSVMRDEDFDQDTMLAEEVGDDGGAAPNSEEDNEPMEEDEPCNAEEDDDWLNDLLGSAMMDIEQNQVPSQWELFIEENASQAPEGLFEEEDITTSELPESLLTVIHTIKENEGMADTLLPKLADDTFYMRHPLWDNWIDTLMSRSSQFFINTFKGTIDPSQPTTSEHLMKILDIKKIDTIVDLSDESKNVYPAL